MRIGRQDVPTPTGKKPAPVASVSNSWALNYTGGAARAADASKPPITVGYINQENSVPSFPDATAGINAATKYVNKELGGADGHPVVIKPCIVQSEEDGQKCATEMANDRNVKFVVLGVTAVGQKAIYSVLTDKKPIISASPATVADLGATDAYAYNPGGPGLIAGMGVFVARKLKAKRVAVVHGNNPAAAQFAEQFLKPLLLRMGNKDVRLVSVADDATGPQVVSAITAAAADHADALVTFLTVPGCIATYDALKSLGIETTVVATGLCFGTPMAKHLEDVGEGGPVPDGWYFANYGFSYFLPDEASGETTYVAKLKEYGGADAPFTAFSELLFANLLTSVKFVNAVGADKLTSATFRAQAKAFKGPMMITSGPMKCGYSRLFPAICGRDVGIEQFAHGTWRPSALGDDSIDVSAVLGG